MNYMADIIRDCSKTRPITFNDISFPITQEIEAKIRNKNISLRKKGRNRLLERQKMQKGNQNKQDALLPVKRETTMNNKSDREQLNFQQVYQQTRPPRESRQFETELQLGKLDQKDEEMTFQIYLMLKKHKQIFKIEQVRRKIKGKQQKKSSLKECECCEKLGKHKCAHVRCEKKCEKLNKKSEKAEMFEQNEEPQSAIAIADELIQAKYLQAPQIATVEIKVKEQEMVMPRIDVIEAEEAIKKEGEMSQCDLPAVVETQRISQVESNSQISQSKKNKSGRKDEEQVEEYLIPNAEQQKIEVQIVEQKIQQKPYVESVKEEDDVEPQDQNIEQQQQIKQQELLGCIQPVQQKIEPINEEKQEFHLEQPKQQQLQMLAQPLQQAVKEERIEEQPFLAEDNSIREQPFENKQQENQFMF